MQRFINDQKGFTLIEIMVVLMIIGVLSSVAVGGYVQYRKATLLDFAVDSFESQLDEEKQNAAFGSFGGERSGSIKDILSGQEVESDLSISDAKCFGMFFEKNSDGFFRVRKFEQAFVGKQIWNNVIGRWIYEGCGGFDPVLSNLIFEDIDLDSDVKVKEIFHNDSQLESLVIRFLPPDGAIEFKRNFEEFQTPLSNDDIFRVKFGYPNSNSDGFEREMIYKLL